MAHAAPGTAGSALRAERAMGFSHIAPLPVTQSPERGASDGHAVLPREIRSDKSIAAYGSGAPGWGRRAGACRVWQTPMAEA